MHWPYGTTVSQPDTASWSDCPIGKGIKMNMLMRGKIKIYLVASQAVLEMPSRRSCCRRKYLNKISLDFMGPFNQNDPQRVPIIITVYVFGIAFLSRAQIWSRDQLLCGSESPLLPLLLVNWNAIKWEFTLHSQFMDDIEGPSLGGVYGRFVGSITDSPGGGCREEGFTADQASATHRCVQL